MQNTTYVPGEDLIAELEKMQSAFYPDKSLDDVISLMIWRGIGRTEELYHERANTKGREGAL